MAQAPLAPRGGLITVSGQHQHFHSPTPHSIRTLLKERPVQGPPSLGRARSRPGRAVPDRAVQPRPQLGHRARSLAPQHHFHSRHAASAMTIDIRRGGTSGVDGTRITPADMSWDAVRLPRRLGLKSMGSAAPRCGLKMQARQPTALSLSLTTAWAHQPQGNPDESVETTAETAR